MAARTKALTRGSGALAALRPSRFALSAACVAFPSGTVHLAVVDPGVGGTRRGLVFTVGGHAFVGPDNGVLAAAAERLALENQGNDIAAVALDCDKHPTATRSRTFQGRDVFAPAAAALASGVPPSDLGAPCFDWQTDTRSEPHWSDTNTVEARVLHVDHFGNLVTNLRGVDVRGFRLEAHLLRNTIARTAASYEAVPPGSPLLIEGGAGLIELAVREGRADELLRLSRGSSFSISLSQIPEGPGEQRRTRRAAARGRRR